MNKKLVLGVVLPLVVCVVLIFLGSIPGGISITTQTVDSVDSTILSDSKRDTQFVLQTLTVSNSNFLSRKVDLPEKIVCAAHSLDKVNPRAIYTRYSESSSSSYKGGSGPADFVLSHNYRYVTSSTVDVGAYEQKEVKLYGQPSYYDWESLDYDQILIVTPQDPPRYRYSVCQDLTTEERNSATVIPIVQ